MTLFLNLRHCVGLKNFRITVENMFFFINLNDFVKLFVWFIDRDLFIAFVVNSKQKRKGTNQDFFQMHYAKNCLSQADFEPYMDKVQDI